jgi:predicted MFS family arabinose efflux permease/quinol monooxygenase YgiN
MTPALLLALTFANGIGLAMRWPVFAAIVPELVPRDELPAALGLNSIAMNASRIIGPVLAGALIASFGSAYVFGLNAVLSLAAAITIWRWRRAAEPASALPGERFVGAMRVGLQFVRQSPAMLVILARIFLFFLQSTALLALLPLVAQGLHGGGPGAFTLLLAGLGAGAVVAALFFPRWRARFDRDQFLLAGTLVHAAMSVVVVLAPEFWMALPAMFVCGMAWISVANSLTTAAQLALPNWVRARGMAIYQMALMGGAAAGSLLWGQVASWSTVGWAVIAAALAGPLVLVASRRFRVEGSAELDFSPAKVRPLDEVAIPIEPDAGPVMVTIEYRIDPAEAPAFVAVMQETRQARLRQGALSWGLFKDTAVPGRYVEDFVDENWVEHQRRLERFTASDAGLRERRMAFHQGPELPRIKRYVAESMDD